MGFKVICLDPNPDSPCKSVAHEFITAAMTMKKLCMNSVRNLMLSLMSLKIFRTTYSSNSKFNIPQGYQAIQLLQDRLTENKHYNKRDLKLFLLPIKEEKDLNVVINQLGYPFIVKTRFGGYDGKGQVLVKMKNQFKKLKISFHNKSVAEQFLDIALEVSLTVTIGNQNKLRISSSRK